MGDVDGHLQSDVSERGEALVNEQQKLECRMLQGQVCKSAASSISVSDEPIDAVDRVFGLRWTESEFITFAASVGHPFHSFSGAPPEVKIACERLAQSNPESVMAARASVFRLWMKKLVELKDKEVELKATLSRSASRIFKSKRISLMN